jgi:hypothetical protein
VYFINFHNGFSDNSANWGDFGSYFGGIIGVFLTSINTFLLIITLKEQIKINNEERERRNEEKSKIANKKLMHMIDKYISIYKSKITDKVFINDFIAMNKELNTSNDTRKIINDFILSDTLKRFIIIENMIICTNKLKKLDEDEFNFIINKIEFELGENFKKYVILAINSDLYKNRKLLKQYLFWNISIKPEILIKQYTQTLYQLLNESCPDGNYYYIEWKD